MELDINKNAALKFVFTIKVVSVLSIFLFPKTSIKLEKAIGRVGKKQKDKKN